MSSDIGEKIFKKRARLREAGKRIWGILVFIGLLGWIFWKWYALLISFGLAILIGSIYSFITAKKMERETDLDINGQEFVQKLYLYQKAEFEKQVERNLLGIELERAGKTDEAIKLYEENIKENFEGNHPYDRLAIIYRKRNQINEEIRVLEKAVWVFENVVLEGRSDRGSKLAGFRHRLDKAKALNI